MSLLIKVVGVPGTKDMYPRIKTDFNPNEVEPTRFDGVKEPRV